MSWTKRQFVEQAFEEIGLSDYVFNLQAEQLQSALRRLDAMLGLWNAKGIRLGDPIPASPEDSDLDSETNVPDSAVEAIYKNLAIRLAPTVGKSISRDIAMTALASYNTLLALAATRPTEMQLSKMPLGQGNKPFRDGRGNFTRDPVETLDAGPDSVVDLEG